MGKVVVVGGVVSLWEVTLGVFNVLAIQVHIGGDILVQ